jgi:hypothetical protein
MSRAVFASALFLLLAGSASAADLTASNAPVPDAAQIPVFMPTPTPAASCTVSCWLDPTITCTSQAGNCYHPFVKGLEWITCDGATQVCPGY